MKGQTQGTTQRRLRILSDDEIQAIYRIPRFTPQERMEYFSLSPEELVVCEQLHSIQSRIYYILQLGYFKVCHMFFVFDEEDIYEDAEHIRQQYFPDFQIRKFSISKETRLKQQGLILELSACLLGATRDGNFQRKHQILFLISQLLLGLQTQTVAQVDRLCLSLMLCVSPLSDHR
jgi:hypothetical protein